MIGTAAERVALGGTTPTAIPQTSWKELGRTKLTSTGDTCTVTGLANKDNLMILRHTLGGDTSVDSYLRVGNGSIDDGSNYAERKAYSGGSDTTNINYTKLESGNSFGAYTSNFAVTFVKNIATREKLFIDHYVYQRTAGAGNVPERSEAVGKWANTSNVIDQVQMINLGSGSFQTDTELVVLGCDDDEADSGTNFWQELTNTSTIASSLTNTSGTFTAKKYMMFTAHTSSINNSNHGNSYLRLGSSGSIDTGSNYAFRGSINGASDGTGTSNSSGIFAEDYWSSGGGDHGGILYNGYIMNVSGKEKLVIMEVVQGMNGASNPPRRQEPVGKWANTSAQANVLQINAAGGGGLLAGSWRVWGSD